MMQVQRTKVRVCLGFCSHMFSSVNTRAELRLWVYFQSQSGNQTTRNQTTICLEFGHFYFVLQNGSQESFAWKTNLKMGNISLSIQRGFWNSSVPQWCLNMKYSKTHNKISQQIGLSYELSWWELQAWDQMKQSLNHDSGELGSTASFFRDFGGSSSITQFWFLGDLCALSNKCG